MELIIEKNIKLDGLNTFTKSLCPLILKHKIILLNGEVGAGKTTFIKSVLHHLGSNDTVTSPTFSLVNTYRTDSGEVHHFDLYRLTNEEEFLQFGGIDYIDSGALCFIEWPSLIEDYIDSGLQIDIKKISHSERKFCIFSF